MALFLRYNNVSKNVFKKRYHTVIIRYMGYQYLENELMECIRMDNGI